MRNIKLVLGYDGTDFSGWQTQPGYRTVQETLETAIASLTGEVRIRVNASGRTDTGVHAVGQVVNFYSNTHHSPEVLVRAINAHLPSDIVVREAVDVPQAFDANRDARRKLYRYVILDVPRSDASAVDALDIASRIVVVTNQELSAVRSASRLAAALRERHGRDRVLVVVNRTDKQAEIGQADIEKVVAAKVKHMLPSDYRLALQALNQGRPLALDNHNKLAAGFRGLAKELAKIETEPKATEPATSLFGRLKGRG